MADLVVPVQIGEMRPRHIIVIALVLIVAAVLIRRCQQGSGDHPGGPIGETGPGGAPTSVTVKGSDTMVILGQRWAEEYMKVNPQARIQVTGGGSGTGISGLINGTTDIAASSRDMKASEKALAKQRAGVDPVEIPVARDGVSVYVHRSNPITTITFDQLKGIYTGRITSWQEVGGRAGRIVVYSRENSSGTYVFFKEHVLGGADFSAQAQTLPGTAAVVNAVEKDPAGIGYGGIAYGEGIKLLPVKKDDASEAIEPSKETIKAGRYPLSRPLFFYTRGQPQGPTKTFIDWALSEEGQSVVETVGYFPIN